jgi:hypothetical protein
MKKQNSLKISFALLSALAFGFIATGCSSKKVEETPADVAVTQPAPVEVTPPATDVSLGAASSGRSR